MAGRRTTSASESHEADARCRTPPVIQHKSTVLDVPVPDATMPSLAAGGERSRSVSGGRRQLWWRWPPIRRHGRGRQRCGRCGAVVSEPLIVAVDDDGHAGTVYLLDQQLRDLLPQLGVLPGSRLVDQDHGGLVHGRARPMAHGLPLTSHSGLGSPPPGGRSRARRAADWPAPRPWRPPRLRSPSRVLPGGQGETRVSTGTPADSVWPQGRQLLAPEVGDVHAGHRWPPPDRRSAVLPRPESYSNSSRRRRRGRRRAPILRAPHLDGDLVVG
jgi:hypothetical protein